MPPDALFGPAGVGCLASMDDPPTTLPEVLPDTDGLRAMGRGRASPADRIGVARALGVDRTEVIFNKAGATMVVEMKE